MRVLFTTTNWRGLYYCMLTTGWALHAAGHDVLFACAPPQRSTIEQAGLSPVEIFEPLGVVELERISRYSAAVQDPASFTDDVPLLHPLTGRPVSDVREFDVAAEEPRFRAESQRIIGHNYAAAVSFARTWRPDLIIHDLMTPEGVLAAEVTGVPAVYHSLGMFGAAETSLYDPTGAFAEHGVTADRSLIRYVIDPTPSMIMPAHADALRLPIRHHPYNGPGALPLWTLEPPARPRVTMLWSRGSAEFFGSQVPSLREALRATAEAGAEVVVTGPAEQIASLRDLPESVRLLRECPLRMLLPGSAALIHQGSGNPLMSGAAAGLPQLILALTDDGFEMGRRFSRGGSAIMQSGLVTSPEIIAENVSRILDDAELKNAAERMRKDMAANPTAAELVPLMEQLAKKGQITADDVAAIAPDRR